MPAKVNPTNVFPPQKLGSSKTDTALDVSELMLSALRSAADLAPLPYLKQAAGVALEILNIVQGVKDNKSLFKRLAADACGLVYSVTCMYGEMEKEGKVMPLTLDNNLRGLVQTLETIDTFATKHVSRSGMMRIVSYKSDVAKIQGYREMMRQALDVFGLQSSIGIHDTVIRIEKQQERLYQKLQEQEAREAASVAKFPSNPSPSIPPPIPPPGAFSHIMGSGGNFTSVYGNQTLSTGSNNNTSTNSGNVTTITTTNSNNNSSVRHTGGRRRRPRTHAKI